MYYENSHCLIRKRNNPFAFGSLKERENTVRKIPKLTISQIKYHKNIQQKDYDK